MRCRKVAEKDKNVVKGASLRFWHFKAILWVRLDLSNNTFEHLCSLGRFACKFQQKILRGDKKIQTQGCWVRRVLCPPPPPTPRNDKMFLPILYKPLRLGRDIGRCTANGYGLTEIYVRLAKVPTSEKLRMLSWDSCFTATRIFQPA